MYKECSVIVYFCIVICPPKARPDSEFNLFESQQYGESDLLFKDATQCLVHTNHMDYRTILGEDFFSQVESIFNCTHSGELECTHTHNYLIMTITV